MNQLTIGSLIIRRKTIPIILICLLFTLSCLKIVSEYDLHLNLQKIFLHTILVLCLEVVIVKTWIGCNTESHLIFHKVCMQIPHCLYSFQYKAHKVKLRYIFKTAEVLYQIESIF